MDNNKKLFEGLLKADGIDPSGATESERIAFGEMLDEQSKPKRSKPSIARSDIWRIIMKSKIPRRGTIAAGLLIGLFIWFLIAVPNNITLADVQNSINSKTWILIQYENGKQWHNLKEMKSFSTGADKDGRNFYTIMRDNVNGIKRYYHSNWGYQIHEWSVTPKPFPQTPWEYVTGGWDNGGAGKSISHTVEEFTDTIDGRQVIRFDTYNIGPLGIRVLAQQIWADPETRLPVRIRENLGWKNSDYVNTFSTGEFSFPEDGPSNIHDLWRPQDLEVVRNWGVIEPEAKSIVDAAKCAQRQFPHKIQILTRTKHKLSIYYRCDNKFRDETYALLNDEHNGWLPLDYPESNEQIHQWAKDNLTLLEMSIYDGRYEYSYNTGALLEYGRREQIGISLHVEQYDSEDWASTLLPIRSQWPYISNVGPMRVLEDEEGVPPGCVLLRWEDESEIRSIRRDWYVDPERDYICVKQIEFRKGKTGTWTKDWDVRERTELTCLPMGQWYARVDKGVSGMKEFNVRLLTDSEVELLCGQDGAEGFFDGEKLLKEAIDTGADITFWAR